jgi:asparagine synthase (glutamine-hydrolysing)
LKKALAKHVPKEILDRRKVGFPNPSATWLRHDLKDLFADILLDSRSLSRGYFRKAAIRDLFARNSESSPHSAEIFSLVVLELWHRTFIDHHEIRSSPVPSGNLNPISVSAD